MDKYEEKYKKYYAENRELVIARAIKWQKEHPERTKEIARKTYRKHKAENQAYAHDYYVRVTKPKREAKRNEER